MNNPQADGIRIKDSQGRPRIVLEVQPDSGTPFLQLLDDKGVPRLELTLGDDGSPCVRMFSEKSVQCFSVGVSESLCGTGMQFIAPDSSHGATFSVDKDGVDFQRGRI